MWSFYDLIVLSNNPFQRAMKSMHRVIHVNALFLVSLLFTSIANSQPPDVAASTSSTTAYLYTDLPFDATINSVTSQEMSAVLSRHLTNHPSPNPTLNPPELNTNFINVVKTGTTMVTLFVTDAVFFVRMLSGWPTTPVPDILIPMPHSTADVVYYLCAINGESAAGEGNLLILTTVNGRVELTHTLKGGEEYCQPLDPEVEYAMIMAFDHRRVHSRWWFRKHSVGFYPLRSFQYAVMYHPKD